MTAGACARQRGFTLVEVLVSITLVAALIALFAGTVTHVARTLSLTTAMLGMHDAASAIQRVLADRLQGIHPCVSIRCTASAGPDGAMGTGDERMDLTWWTSLQTTGERGSFAGNDHTEQDWFRLTWTGPRTPGAGSQLLLARTSGRRSTMWDRQVADPGNANLKYEFSTVQQARRDRRRDMDDNDLRAIAGMTPAIYAQTKPELNGDGEDLSAMAKRLVPSNFTIEKFAMSWVDRAGWETRFDPAYGLGRRDAAGVAQPWLNTPWSSATSVAIDGMFVDARAYSLPALSGQPADPRDVGDARPVLLRIAFTMRRKPTGILVSRDQDITQRFTLSFPVGPSSAQPQRDWPIGASP